MPERGVGMQAIEAALNPVLEPAREGAFAAVVEDQLLAEPRELIPRKLSS